MIVYCVDKGGSGKTTLSTQSALEMSCRGKKTLLIDNDPQGDSTTTLLGENLDSFPEEISLGEDRRGVSNTYALYQDDWEIEPYKIDENLYLFGSNDSLSTISMNNDARNVNFFANSIDRLLNDFDVIIVDCPPSLGLLYVAGILGSAGVGGVIVPFAPDNFGVKSIKRMQTRLAEAREKFQCDLKVLGYVANKVSPNNPTPTSVQIYLGEAKEAVQDEMFATQITTSLKITDATALGRRVSDWVGSGNAKPANQISSFVDEICDRVGISRGLK